MGGIELFSLGDYTQTVNVVDTCIFVVVFTLCHIFPGSPSIS
jgi:hypothetical protein